MDEHFLNGNLAALETRDPKLASGLSKLSERAGGESSLKAAIGCDESAAERFSIFNHRLILVPGVESLLAARELMGAPHSDCFLFIYEDDPAYLAGALKDYDLSDVLRADSVTVYVGEGEIPRMKQDIISQIINFMLYKIMARKEEFRSIDEFFMVLSALPPERLYLYKRLAPLIDELKAHDNVLAMYSNARHAAEELAEFLGEDASVTTPRVMQGMQLLAADWIKTGPRTPEEIHAWYCDTPYYLHDLCFFHATSGAYKKTVEIVEEMCASRGGAILDFGGGDGDLAIRLAARGLDVTYCDVPGKTLEYALWRFSRRGLDIQYIVSADPNTISLERRFDIIISLDVLEHLVNPMHYCRIFFENLSPGGIFIAKPSFSTQDTLPMHLSENAIYGATFDSEMEKIGFRRGESGNKFVNFWIKPV